MSRKNVSGIMLTLLLIGMLTLAFNIQQVKSDSKTIYVDDDNTTGPWDGTPEHPYQNITSGLEHAIANDTIFAYNGTYYENIIIDKLIALIGEDPNTTIINGSGTGTVITITADNVSITGFTIQNSGSASSDSGIRLEQYSLYGVISSNYIKNNSIGIYLYKCGDCVISGNEIINNSEGIHLETSTQNTVKDNNVANNTGHGIHLRVASVWNIINGNKITNSSSNGIHLSASSNNTISGNIISNNIEGVHLHSSDNNTIISNGITHNDYGIHLYYYSDENVLVSNNIAENNYRGIFLSESSNNNFISSNNIPSNGDGIYLYRSSGNTIRANNITNNSAGIVPYLSNYNVIYHNNFINNDPQVFSLGSSNTWDNGYGNITLFPTIFGGNYWSDQYHGPSADHYSGPYQNETGSDGIVDYSYNITDETTGKLQPDRYPLMSPYIPIHDVAVTNVAISQMWVSQGDYFLDINVTIENMGDYFETFNVTIYYNLSVIDTVEIINFGLGARKTQSVLWNVTEVAPGNYTIGAVADTVPGENNTTNNEYVDGIIRLIDHNIAITEVKVKYGKTLVCKTLFCEINVTVANEGDFTETFNVTLYYNTNPIETQKIENLKNGTSTNLIFIWNTTDVAVVGNYTKYTIKAYATPIPAGETETTDNTFTDGNITVAKMVGDITGSDGWPDGKCDIKDIAVIAKLYGVNYPDPRYKYNPNCDLTGPTLGLADGKIDIRDIGLIAIHYGEMYP